MEIRGNYGVAYLQDCLIWMKAQADKSISLIFTDNVWGHNYHLKAQKPMGINKKAKKQNRIPYNDEWKPDFQAQWFTEAQRISEAQVVCVGRVNLKWWYRTFDVIDSCDVIYKNGQGSTAISRYSGKMPYLCFGDLEWWKHHKFHRDYYEVYIHNGFLRDNEEELKHPSPKDFTTWNEMIQDLNSEKRIPLIYDCFLGSGCLAEVCEANGYPWVGTEIKEDYADDIQLRIAKGQGRYPMPKRQRTQKTTLLEMIK
jgi:DNA modification methylase